MSSEIKEDEDVRDEHQDNHDDEQSAEIIKSVSLDEQEENEPSLATPNGRETPSATSFSDVIIEKPDEQPEPETTSTSTNTHQLLQIVAEKSNKEANSAILNTLVEGDFDLDKNYIIEKPENLAELFAVLNQMSPSLQAELLSVLIGIMRKSERNLLVSSDAQIYQRALELLSETDDAVVADLLVDVLTVLTSLTINAKQFKLLLRYLKTENHVWKRHAVKLLSIFKNLPYRHGPDEFFNFPGRNGSGIILPPIKTWPYQNGFTVSTWFRIDPVVNGVIEKEKPYLFWFCTSKGHGYTAHFVGNCLVVSVSKVKEKTFQHCIQFEFKAREWYMITIAYQYQRWSKSSIQCHINGQLASTAYFPWSIESGDVFDKCYIGCTPDRHDLTSFSGQLSTFYMFSLYLDPLIVQGLYKIGPAYKNQFKFENESAHILTEAQRKAMYDGKLMSAIVFNYNPVACEEQLVLQAGPKANVTHFVHNAHAQMLSQVRAVRTHSIYSTLHSIGGIQIFFPLFEQFDHQQIDGSTDYQVASVLLLTLCQLIERSYTIQHQMLNSKGFLIIGYHLEKASKQHITMEVLNSLISLTTFFVNVQSKNSPLLLKQLFVQIFFNPSIWISCPIDIQMRLYTYLATEFVTYAQMYQSIQPISGIIQTLHTLKYFYWIAKPSDRNNYQAKSSADEYRPTRDQIIEIRRYMLLFMKQLVISSPGTQEDELQAILNYLHTIHEDENLIDVLEMSVNLMSEHPKTMVPAFDRRQGLRTVFQLLTCGSESIRLQALKLFGFFLQRSTLKRKTDAMQPHNLFSLLADHLLLHPNGFSMATYNILFEILVERVNGPVVEKRSTEISAEWKIENPAMIKVIATLLRNAPHNIHLYDIKYRFLDDLILLSSANRENRRIVLQMSVWQDYLLSLAYVYPSNDQQTEITDRVFELLKVLLHHAIKFEFGGWRVWIDTLSILHARVTKEDYYRATAKMVENMKDNDENEQKTPVSSGSETPVDTPTKSTASRQVFSSNNQLPPFTIPEFKYSPMHIRLLHSVFDSIEVDVRAWRCDASRQITETINHADNQIFCVNVVHIISQMSDILSNACGGLLPLLASATSASHEIEVLENTEGLSPLNALKILKRVMGFADLFILGNSSGFAELEQEKNMPTGGIIRQCLRLAMTTAVRHCMECRFQRFEPASVPKPPAPTTATKTPMKDPIESILEMTYLMNAPNENETDHTIEGLLSSFIRNPQSVLQELDIQRLRAIIYRDVDDTKQSQFLSLAIIYFTSVLMVSRYRDIIEANQSSLSRTTSFVSTTTRLRNGSTADGNTDTASTNGLSSIVAPLTNSSKLSDDPNNTDETIDAGNDTDNTDSQSIDAQSAQPNATQYTSIASIPVTDGSIPNKTQIPDSKLPDYPKTTFNSTEQSVTNITEKLERTLANVAPFLRDIFTEFSHILTKTLVGSHGQELLPNGLHALKQSASVVELVMLLCSQEWQNSLQKHAGLAFIELVNEGRLLSHASKDHVVKVANEADFILNRMRADDIRKASELEQLSNQTTLERQEEEHVCDHFIHASRQRYELVGSRLKEKFLSLMVNDTQAYLNQSCLFWKLDPWEDDLRRRRRLIRNPFHAEYEESLSHSANNEDETINTLPQEEYLLKQSKLQQQQKTQSFLANHHEEDDMSQVDERDLEHDFSGPIRFATPCLLICGTLALPGTLAMTQNAMLFDTNESDPDFRNIDPQILPYVDNLHGKWHFTEIRAIFSRRYLLQERALEIFVSNRTSVMFAFTDRSVVKKVVNVLPRVGVGGRYGLPQQRRTSLASPKQVFRSANMTQRWQRREISNFEYLMYLNTIAGRTYQDLNQYPIFPWIIADYDSEKLDLNSAASYRDLSKPVGALNPTRKTFFVERYNNWDSEIIPAYHYSTHYSTAASTLYWLLRLEPFTTFYSNFRGEKLDEGNRIFHSIPLSWQNCQRDSSDVKELIPEFFSLPEMFNNGDDDRFNRTEDDENDETNNDHVVLPKWAQTPEDFIRINRAALESEFVSCHLHHWIDLIFGYKQRGPEAVRATNVFYYLTYEGVVNLDALTNLADRAAIEKQIKNFGQVPSQLLTEPHPPRNSPMASTPTIYNAPTEDVCMIMKFSSNAPIIHVSANTNPTLPIQAVLTISNRHDFSVNKYNLNAAPSAQPYSEPTQTVLGQSTQLPISMDSLLVLNTGLHRRHLGDSFDERLQQRHQSFVVTGDNRFIISTGYWDKSFRVQNTDMARTTQVLYGHFDLVTCVCRSEVTVAGNCFLATGSRDSTVCIWIWNGAKGAIVDKEYPNQDINPSPAAILTGHETEITCLWISAELGIVLSGSEHSLVLEHTLTGEILRSFENPSDMATPRLLLPSNEGDILVCYDRSKLCLYTLNGKLMRQAIFEDETIQSLVLNGDSQYVVIGGDRGFVQIIRTHDLQPVYAYPQCDASIRSLAITHDQKYIMAGLSTGCLIVFNVNFNALSQPRRENALTKNAAATPNTPSTTFLQ